MAADSGNTYYTLSVYDGDQLVSNENFGTYGTGFSDWSARSMTFISTAAGRGPRGDGATPLRIVITPVYQDGVGPGAFDSASIGVDGCYLDIMSGSLRKCNAERGSGVAWLDVYTIAYSSLVNSSL